jgi:FkbM family methyltransferase
MCSGDSFGDSSPENTQFCRCRPLAALAECATGKTCEGGGAELLRLFVDNLCGTDFEPVGKRPASDRFSLSVQEVGMRHFLQTSFLLFGCQVPSLHLNVDGLITLAPSIKRLKIDVGLSNAAPISQQWLEGSGEVAIFAFEPNGQNVAEIISGRNRARGRGLALDPSHIGERFFLFPVACGSVRKTATFYATKEDPGTSSLFKPNGQKSITGRASEQLLNYNQYSVPVVPLADLLAHIPWGFEGEPGRFPVIDFLKIDAQGADLEVLKGAGDYLRERIVCVTAERYEGIYDGGHTDQELLTFMSARGFQLVSQMEWDFNFVNTYLTDDWLADAECCFGDPGRNSISRSRQFRDLPGCLPPYILPV